MKKAAFSTFLALTLTSFFPFCWSVLQSLDMMTESFFSFSLTCAVYLPYLLKKCVGFPIPYLLAYHKCYLQLYRFFFPASSLELSIGETTFAESACTDSASSKLCDIIYCDEYILLDNISSCLPVIRARPFRITNKIDRGWKIGLCGD